MRAPLDRDKLRAFMAELARGARGIGTGRVYLVGGGTAVWLGWRPSTIDVDLHGEPEQLFSDIQGLKERLSVNVEFARPEDFVPELPGSGDRHVFVEKIGAVSYYHHDPYAQTFSKVARGFERDLEDAERFVGSGMVDPVRLSELVGSIAAESWAKYPALSPAGTVAAVEEFVKRLRKGPSR